MVVISAIRKDTSEPMNEVMINPDHISEVYRLDNNSFAMKLINGSEYVINNSELIRIASETSSIFKEIYEFVYGETEDERIDRLAEEWNNRLDFPDPHY